MQRGLLKAFVCFSNSCLAELSLPQHLSLDSAKLAGGKD